MPEIVVMNPAPRRRRRNSAKRRSPAQRAATARMLAANRRHNPAKRRRSRVRHAIHAVAGAVRRRVRRYARRSNPAVRHYRRTHGLTQDDLAILLGSGGRSYISMLESGDRVPHIRDAVLLSWLFDASPETLFPAVYLTIHEHFGV